MTPRAPFDLGPIPSGLAMVTTDDLVVRATPRAVYDVVVDVARWPERLGHYRFVRFRENDGAGGGIVEMAANRPFGPLNWPTWWLSDMQVIDSRPAIRFRHIGGVTSGMEVEWSFAPHGNGGTLVRVLHVWNGPRWPIVGRFAAVGVIGPVFIHGIASLTLSGLAAIAEQGER